MIAMKTQITDLFGLNVYTDRGIFVGEVEDAVINVDGKKIDSIAVGNLSPEIRESKGYKGLRIPYRIIRNVGDIVIIRHIPNAFRSSSTEQE